MKIIIISNTFFSIKNFRNNLINKLLESHNLLYLIGNNDKYSLCYKNKENIYREFVNFRNPFLSLSRVFFIIKKIKPDRVYSYTYLPNCCTLVANFFFNFDCIITITGLGIIRTKIYGFFFLYIYKILLKDNVKIFFQNRHDKFLFYKLKIGNNKNYNLVFGSGLDNHYYNELISSDRLSRVEGRKYKLYFIGRLIPDKGIMTLIHIKQLLNSDRYEFYVVGNCTSAILKNLFFSHSIKFIDHNDYPYKYINDADAILFLSKYGEGIPKILIEASFLGCPILALRGFGISSIVKHGYNGLIFDNYHYLVDFLINLKFDLSIYSKPGNTKHNAKFFTSNVLQKYL